MILLQDMLNYPRPKLLYRENDTKKKKIKKSFNEGGKWEEGWFAYKQRNVEVNDWYI